MMITFLSKFILVLTLIAANIFPLYSTSPNTSYPDGPSFGSIRITSPMQGWSLDVGKKIAISYFSLWSCKNDPSAFLMTPESLTECDTEVFLDGRRILTAVLASENQFSKSATVQADLQIGEHIVEITVRTRNGGGYITAAVSRFNIVPDRHWHGLSIKQGWELPDDRPQPKSSLNKSSIPSGRTGRRKTEILLAAATTTTPQSPSHSALRSAVMLYHRDLERLYPARWVHKCITSLLAQTHAEFDIWELDYGGGERPAMAPHLHRLDGRRYTFLSRRLASHAAAMNYLLDAIFDSGYDVAFNVRSLPPPLLFNILLSSFISYSPPPSYPAPPPPLLPSSFTSSPRLHILFQ
jgi:hypothetical protein